MSFRWSQRLVLALGILTGLLGAGSMGCMGERPAVNRVQPDYLDKQQLIPVQYEALVNGAAPGSLSQEMIAREPQWVHQITIIDKPATTGFTGLSWYTNIERINWEVTENFLIARQAYDRLHNGQSMPAVSRNPRQGEILAVYRIVSHFDIRRSYNPQTGEEQNVIEENSSDRPWYQRRYMRVDWSQNLVSGYSAMEFAEWQGRVRAEPVPYWINNPSDPNRPVFNYGTFRGQENVLTYFDITNRAVLHPEEINLASEGYPNLPACLLIARPGESCQPADVTMRVAFMRVDPDRDYQPQSMDGHRMERFGFFDVSRVGFNRDYNQIQNTDRRHFAARHNLWMQHHARPANNALDHLEAIIAHNATLGPNETPAPVAPPVRCQTDDDCFQVSPTAACDQARHECGERYIRCTNDAQCASVGFGSRCDIDIAYTRSDRDPQRGEGYGLCLLPFRQRTVRPLAYHLSENYPEHMMLVTEDIVRNWNDAFSRAVMSARHRECLLDPAVTDKSTCETYRDPNHPNTADARFVFVGCHNPVWGTDPNLPGAHTQAEVDDAHRKGWDLPACGPQGTVARLGDIRYSMIGAATEFDQQGAWGLANISGDPVTGEVYQGRGLVWQTITELQAAWATDLIRVLNGDLSPEQIALGENIVSAYSGVLRGLDERTERSGRNTVPQIRPVHRDIQSRTELENILAQTNFRHMVVTEPRPTEGASGARANILPNLDTVSINDYARGPDGTYSERNFIANLSRVFSRSGLFGRPGYSSVERRQRLAGTEIEGMLLNQDEIDAAGFNAELGLTDAAREAASPFRRNNLAFRSLRNRLRMLHSMHQCNYEAEFSDDVVETLIYRFRNNSVPADVSFGREWNFRAPGENEAGNPNLNYDEIRRYLVQFIHRGVLAHELGHSIGQRHNFAASADAVNYRDEYWELRGRGHRRGIVPRFEHMADGEGFYSQEEREGGIEEYAYSSVMDYKGFNEDAHGLGRYDYAFVKHGYVDMVEAFDQVADRTTAINMFQTIGGGGQQVASFGLLPNGRLTSFHYTDLPRVVGTVTRNGQTVPNVGDDNRFDVFLWETSREGYNAFNWTPDHTNVANADRDGSPNPGGHLLVPYRFASDEYAGYYWYDQRYDAGADMFESIRYTSVRYLDYYFANAFARERTTFTTESYRSRMESRYLENLYYVMRLAAIYEVFYANIFAGVPNRAEWERQPATVANRLGIATSIDTFANAILMPQSSAQYGGAHVLRTRPDGTRVYEQAQFGDRNELDIRIGDGREFQTYYDWASGYFWRDRIINAGSYHDKVQCLDFMTDTFLFSAGRAFDVMDLRDYQVNMYTVYPGQTIRFFGSLLSRDHADVGPLVRNPGPRYTLERTRIATLNLPPGTGPGQNGRDPSLNAVDPNLNFTGELFAATYAMTGLSGTFDQRFIQFARLWADGDNFAVPTSAGTPLVSFTDPATGLVYRAIHMGGGPGEPGEDVGLSARDRARNETGIGARMLLHAQDLRNAMEAAPAGSPRRQALARELQQYVDLLNVMRNLNRYFSTGNQGLGE